MTKKQKLELTWVGKENRPRLEPRILIEDPAKSYHAAARVSDGDIFDNVLIHGDNLLALKALEADYAGKVKCVFIDPPYNTLLATQTFNLLNRQTTTTPDGVIYVESGTHMEPLVLPSGWEIFRQKAQGEVRYQLYQKIKETVNRESASV